MMKGVSERDDKEDFIEVETTREKVDNQIVLYIFQNLNIIF